MRHSRSRRMLPRAESGGGVSLITYAVGSLLLRLSADVTSGDLCATGSPGGDITGDPTAR